MEKLLKYTLSLNGAFPEETLSGGIQGENRATAIVFEADSALQSKISLYKEQGKSIEAKILAVTESGECVDQTKQTGDNLFSPFYLTDRVTSTGLDVIIVLKLLVVEEQKEICKAQIRLSFIPSPVFCEFESENKSEAERLSKRAEEINAELKEKADDITKTIEQKLEAVKTAASLTAQQLKTVKEIADKANQTRLSLESGMEFVFSGGDAYQSASAEWIVDDELSEVSGNPVENKVVTQSFSQQMQEINVLKESHELLSREIEALKENDGLHSKDIEELKADYIVEQGVSGIWTYRKWTSGVSECEAAYDETLTTLENNDLGRVLFFGSLPELNFPTNIFKDIPSCTFSVNSAGYPMARIHTLTNGLIRLRCFTEWAVSAPSRVSVIAKGRWK